MIKNNFAHWQSNKLSLLQIFRKTLRTWLIYKKFVRLRFLSVIFNIKSQIYLKYHFLFLLQLCVNNFYAVTNVPLKIVILALTLPRAKEITKDRHGVNCDNNKILTTAKTWEHLQLTSTIGTAANVMLNRVPRIFWNFFFFSYLTIHNYKQKEERNLNFIIGLHRLAKLSSNIELNNKTITSLLNFTCKCVYRLSHTWVKAMIMYP